ncbi:hypothetical protein BVY00_01470 [bacterium G20]|nr:hypothetical protein BVY00_01470 [bacterium G20]
MTVEADKNTKQSLISIIVPVFNEAEGLEHFHTNLKTVLAAQAERFELIYVDDGSSDDTPGILKKIARHDERVKILTLSRNFGKEQATTAGLHAATGDAVIIIDGDGQHPVELIPSFIDRWQKGAHVVVGVRTANQKEGFVKRTGSKLFYSSLRVFGVPNIVPGSTDFRLIDKQVLLAFKNLTERNRVTRALIDWLGYERDYIEFVANPRRHGSATYSFKKLIRLALNGFVSLSFMPLYLSGYMGVFITLLSFLTSIFAIVEKYLLNDPWHLNITGTAILGVMILFLVGILLIGQGLLAIYVARIYTEVQNRPLYLLKD